MTSSRRLFCIVALLLCFVILHSAAAAPFEIRFQSGAFLPESGHLIVPAEATSLAGDRVHALVQIEDYLHRGQREALAAAGVELLNYLPDRAYVASVRISADVAALQALGVRYLGPLTAEQKTHPRVSGKRFGKWSEYTQGRRILAVDIMPDVSLDEAASQIEKMGFETGHRFESVHALLVAVEPEGAGEVAALDAVLFVNECPPPLQPVNNSVRIRLHVDEVRAAPYNLSGQGVIALVYDGGMVDSTHPDFGDRVTWMEDGAVADHSTHVSGTLGGSGQASGGTYAGMAPQTRIISGEYDACDPYCFYDSPLDVEPDYTVARQVHHVELTTNSMGANVDANQFPVEWFGDYELTSRILDRLVSNTAGTPLLQFWAAGNERNGTNYNWTSYGCMAVPAGAKNVIAVGATDDADAVASFSSWGPTDDGRIKPELCATGINVTSCITGGGYATYDGTSMSSPAAAGVACLILQKWHLMFPGAADPLPETMKAILINSATDIGPVGPDFGTGYGLVNALKAVQNLVAGGVLESALEIGETFSRSFTVPAGLSALDVSLAWSDLPAVGNVIPTLVNDLDLELQDPSATIYYPWKLRPASPSLPVITGVDSINVCERVHVASPAAGNWTLRVRGRLNGSASQTFGLSANVPLATAWASVVGQIRRTSDDQGIRGRVSVVGGAQSSLTDTSGNFVVALPANAQYTIRAESYGFVARDTTLTLTTGSVTVNPSLTAAQNGTLHGVVRNQLGAPLPQAEVHIEFPLADIPPLTGSASGEFTIPLPGGNTYRVLALWDGMAGQATAAVPEGATGELTVTIYHRGFLPTGPDAYGYYAFEIGDSGSNAVYDWLEISPNAGGAGTLIPSPGGNDWVVTLSTPFPIRFYGQTANQIQVGADGWVRVGPPQTADSVYVNRDIPNTRAPNGMICLFWDDLFPYAAEGGDVSHYYDQAHGRFIVEYHDVPHFLPRTNRLTAQLVFFDTSVRPTASGDNEFQLQYQRFDYEDSTDDADATVGIEDFEGDDGLQIVMDGVWDVLCFPLGPQSAILFTPGGIHAVGAAGGEVTLIPPPADWSAVNVTLGSYLTHPDLSGVFLLDNVAPGSYALTVTLAGYETGRVETLVVVADDTAQTAFTLCRLDPAWNLTGVYDPDSQRIHLSWNWPLWHSTLAAAGQREGEHLDAFRGFRVWVAGLGLQGSVADTFFTYHVTQSRPYRFWIETLYDYGVADTSNNFRITIDLSARQTGSAIPAEFYLRQNYPNPFNPVTLIEYGLPKAAHVDLDVFDVLGRKVAVLQSGIQEPGVYRAALDGALWSSGVYYCRLKAGEFERVQKMLLMR
ncbi:MAG: S8 family serine peptidase [bacterium]|nr:S8 family serine peptidase [bacterium]